MLGQDHTPSPQVEMPGDVVGEVEGRQENSLPSLMVTAGGSMGQLLHPLFKTQVQTSIPPPMSFSFCSLFQIRPFCEAHHRMPAGALISYPMAVAPKGGLLGPQLASVALCTAQTT